MTRFILAILLLISGVCAANCKTEYDMKKKMFTTINDEESSILKMKILGCFKDNGEDWIAVDVCFECTAPINRNTCYFCLDLYDNDDFPIHAGEYFIFEQKVVPEFVGKLHTRVKVRLEEFLKIASYRTYVHNL